MNEEKYDLVFKGQLAKSVDINVAKRNLSALFKISPEKTDALFSGKPVVLKRNLDADSANKYRVAIKKAGALVDLVLAAQPTPVKSQPERPRGKAVFGPQDEASPQTRAEGKKSASDTIEYTTPVKTPVPQEAAPVQIKQDEIGSNSLRKIDTSAYSLAPAGADLLLAADKQAVEAPEIDLSAFSLKPTGGTLLDPDEYPADLPFVVEITDVDLAPVGADVLTEEERKPLVTVNVDTSGLSLAEPGVRLAPPKPEPPRAPDVSNISLADEN